MRSLNTVAGFLLIALSLASPAAAQDVFSVPGKILLRPADAGFAGRLPQAIDNAGYLYFATQGGVQCHHPSDPEGTFHSFAGDNFYDANGTIRGLLSTHLQALPDGSGVEAAFVASLPDHPQFNLERVRVHRFDCTMLHSDGQGGAGGVRVGGDVRKYDGPLFAGTFDAHFIKRGRDTFCFPSTSEGVVCVDLSTTPATATQLVTHAALTALFDPGLTDWYKSTPTTRESWTASALTDLPNGRTFFIASHTYFPNLTTAHTTHTYIVELRADGTLAKRFGPMAAASFDTLIYSAELDALLAWPFEGIEFSIPAYLDGLSGWAGYGFRVLPLGDATGSGYLGLSLPLAPLLERCVTAHGACQPFQVGVFGGELLVEVMSSGNGNVLDTDLWEVHFDPAALDLDDDGLNAAQEAAAGTSDTRVDSDGAGTPDGIEVKVLHTDPRSPRGEPAHQVPAFGSIRYVTTGLVPDKRRAAGYDTQSVGANGPLCSGGECTDPNGEVVFRYPIERATTDPKPKVSADGTFIMLETAEGLVRYWFADGREELALSAVDFGRYVPASIFTKEWIPIDGDRTWIISDGSHEPDLYPARIALVEGDTVTVMYDHTTALRESAPSPSQQVDDVIGIIGWNEVTEQLLIGVRATWDSYFIGVGADASVTLLSRGRSLAGKNGEDERYLLNQLGDYPPQLPGYIVPTGHGDFFTGGALMEPYGGFRDAGLPYGVAALGYAPYCAWGDVLPEPVCFGYAQEPRSGVIGTHEMVRYDQALEPGDVLMLLATGNGNGWTLHKSGPRGGVAPVWPAAVTDYLDVNGIDLAPDGSMRLCLADAGNGILWELEPAGPRTAPEIFRYSVDVPGIIDCAYEADGTLRVLAKGPARELTRAAGDDFADLAPAAAIAQSPDPLEYLRKPDGTLELRRRDGLRGKAYLPDGRVVSMRDTDFVVRLDDAPVLTIPRLVYNSFVGTAIVPPDFYALVTFAVRPDGRVLVVPHHAEFITPYATLGDTYVVDLDAKTAAFLSGDFGIGGGMGSVSVVVVPGGTADDPWTGELAGPSILVPPGVDAPQIPAAPSGGEAVAGGDGGGCGGGGGPTDFTWAAVALGMVLVRRALGRRSIRG